MARLILVCLLALLLLAPAAPAAEPPPNVDYSEEYIPDGPAERLHADIFRPKGVEKAPVILTVSPYTGHAIAGGEDVPYDPTRSGPSDRFYDFLNGSGVLSNGYAYVMVDLPGYGGSSGCGDWGGPREQQAVRTAVEWAAQQPWSTGKVALFGKSYDAWTGIMGVAHKPAGLSAVVAMEPVYSGYRYFWTNGIRISNTLGTPQAFRVYDLAPGSPSDSPEYHVYQQINTSPGCQATNSSIESADPAEDSIYWAPRNLIPLVKGSPVPLFLTQGFLENNTKPDGAFDVYNTVGGPKRAWFGQFGHWRGYEREGEDQSGPYKTGRDAFMGELVRFLEQHLKGNRPSQLDPDVEVQSAPDGRWRAEKAWPPADAKVFTSRIKTGAISDDGEGTSTSAEGVWSVSQPLAHRMHLAGEPVLTATVTTPARANLVVNLYDVAPDGQALLVSRMGGFVGASDLSFKLYGQDWIFEPGHRIAVRLTDANFDWWRHVPSNQTITVEEAAISLPFLNFARNEFLSGGMTPDLENHVASAFDVPAEALAETTNFELPGPLAAPTEQCACPPKALRLTLKVKRAKRRSLKISGTSPPGRVTVRVLKGRKTVARKRAAVRNGRYSVRLKLRKRGKYTVRVAGPKGLGASKRVRVR